MQIRQALPSATGQQRTELEQLEKDLLELIELTQPSSTACSVGEGLLESSQSNLEVLQRQLQTHFTPKLVKQQHLAE